MCLWWQCTSQFPSSESASRHLGREAACSWSLPVHSDRLGIVSVMVIPKAAAIHCASEMDCDCVALLAHELCAKASEGSPAQDLVGRWTTAGAAYS